MAEICTFRGVHYNQLLFDNLSSVICPPYDIITPQLQQELYHRSRYNFVRLEHGRELPQDTATNNRYSRSANTLEDWLKEGVLIVDETPAIYLHDHYFTLQEREYKRRGIIALVRLEELDKRVVRPHEGTLEEPRSDRLSLLWAIQANTSSILALFEDSKQQISALLAKQESNKPIISTSSTSGERHDVWSITQPDIITQISNCLTPLPIYIADGHHRYESALAYRREKYNSFSPSGCEAYNFVMMTLVEFSDPGLIVLPPHRLVRGIAKATLDELIVKLESIFEIERLSISAPNISHVVDRTLAHNINRLGIVLFSLASESLIVLRLHDFATASQMMPYFHSELYRKLNVSIIDHIILENLLGLSSGREKTRIAYSYDSLDAISRVLDQEYQLAILLSPVRIEMIKAIADAGDQMPRKSTYFYPKLPAGLIFNILH